MSSKVSHILTATVFQITMEDHFQANNSGSPIRIACSLLGSKSKRFHTLAAKVAVGRQQITVDVHTVNFFVQEFSERQYSDGILRLSLIDNKSVDMVCRMILAKCLSNLRFSMRLRSSPYPA